MIKMKNNKKRKRICFHKILKFFIQKNMMKIISNNLILKGKNLNNIFIIKISITFQKFCHPIISIIIIIINLRSLFVKNKN
jgi:hypothetical protein